MPTPDHVPPGWAAEVETLDALASAEQGIDQATCYGGDRAILDAAKVVFHRHQDLRAVLDQCRTPPHHDTAAADEIAQAARGAVQRTYAALNALWLNIGRTTTGDQ